MALLGLFSGLSYYAGVGFSLGRGVTLDLAKTGLSGSLGQYFWGGWSCQSVVRLGLFGFPSSPDGGRNDRHHDVGVP